MTRKQYTEALELLGLTPYSAPAALGIKRRQSFRYASGESKIPEPVARLLQMYRRHGIPREWRE